MMRTMRRISQIIFFLLFLFLLVMTEYRGVDSIPYPVKIFFDLDPLAALTTFLAAHSIPAMMFWSLVVVAISVLFGRFFCAWVCPMGTLNHLSSFVPGRKKAANIKRNGYDNRQRFKYYLVLGVLIAAAFGLQLTGWLDPFSVLIRSFGLAVYPVFNFLIRSAVYPLLALDWPWLTPIVADFYSFMRAHVLSFEQPYFYQGVLIGLIFTAILLLNTLRRRFWCRYLCPLGALLGFLSRFSLLKLKVDENKCTHCNACKANCEGACEPQSTESWIRSECLPCYNCVESCPSGAVKLTLTLPKLKGEAKVDLTKRALVGSGLTALGAMALLRIDPRKSLPPGSGGNTREVNKFNPSLIRPPGAVMEQEFLERCIKCGECMKVCIKNAIHPTLMEAGLEGMWTPYLKMQLGYCEYNCTLCGQVCPTGALQKLTQEKKHQTKIGLAMFDKNRCIPYSLGKPCIVCEEVCPTSPKAIKFEEVEVIDYEGKPSVIKRPYIDPDLCVGCGICEYVCPLVDKPGIYVTSIGETRSRLNQLLLDVYGRG